MRLVVVGLAFLAVLLRPDVALAVEGSGSDSSRAVVAADTVAASMARDLSASDAARMRALFTPENRRYARVRQTLAIVEPLYEIAALLLLLATGLSARMRELARRLTRHRYGRVLVYLGLLTAVMLVAEAPLTWFREYYWEHRHGLSNQSLGAWAWEGIESAALGFLVVGGTGLVALALAFIERMGRRAWIVLALGMLPVMLAGVLLQPLVIDPVFNNFTPLQNEQLRGKILALAERSGIPGRRVYEVNRSKQTKTLNAYVSGFGPSQRIVLWDTSLQAFREDEMLSVMGHEMGHYKLAHLWKGTALFWLLGFVLFFGMDRLARWALARRGRHWGVTELHDEAAIPLLAATLLLLLLVTAPVSNGFSRAIEHEADRFGLDVTHDNDAAARSFLVMAERNRSDPDPPLPIKLLLYSHPTLAERVRFAREYHPWADSSGAPR